MKILQVLSFFSGQGGIGRSVADLSEAFVSAGHEVDVVYWEGERAGSFFPPQVNVKKIDLFGLPSSGGLVGSILWRYGCRLLGRDLYLCSVAPFTVWQLKRRVLKHEHYDLILFHRFHFLGSCSLPNCILVVHTTVSEYIRSVGRNQLRLSAPARQRLFSNMLKNKKIIAVSEGVKEDLKENFGVSESDVSCIHNPISPARIESLSRQATNRPVPERYIIAVGRLASSKRFDLLIRAYARAKIEEDLIFLGGGSLNRLKDIAYQLGVQHKVHFLGFQPNPYPYIRKARLLVLSSVYEGFPTVIMEALACGVPVVSTDCPHGPREILTGDMSKWLVPVRDEEALSKKIRQVLDENPVVDGDVLKRFEPENVARRYIKESEKLLSGASPQ